MHAGLIVEDEFLGQQMKNFAIVGQRNRTGAVDRLLDLIASDFSRSRAHGDAAVAVNAANMHSSDADDGLFDRSAGDVFGGFNRLLNRGHGLVEFDDHAFARASGFGDAMTPVA